VTGVFPYLAYARHDKDKPNQSLSTAWTGALARASGIDQVITVDVHSEKAQRLFPIPVLSLSPAQLFAKALNRYGSIAQRSWPQMRELLAVAKLSGRQLALDTATFLTSKSTGWRQESLTGG
jgi:hypothetical protein